MYTFDSRAPNRFGMTQVVLTNLLAFLPSFIFGAFVGIGLMSVPIIIGTLVLTDWPLWVALTPLYCLGIAATGFFFTPGLLMLNWYFRTLAPPHQANAAEPHYICQITMQPRLYSGLREFLDDADDIGVLTINSDRIHFHGDHSELTVDLSNDVRVELCNIGWRAFFFASRRIRLHLAGDGPLQSVEFSERQSWSVPKSRKLAQYIFKTIQANIYQS